MNADMREVRAEVARVIVRELRQQSTLSDDQAAERLDYLIRLIIREEVRQSALKKRDD